MDEELALAILHADQDVVMATTADLGLSVGNGLVGRDDLLPGLHVHSNLVGLCARRGGMHDNSNDAVVLGGNARIEGGNVRLQDHITTRVSLIVEPGMVRAVRGVFNSMQTLDVRTPGLFSICRILSFARHAEVDPRFVNLTIQNCLPVSPGDALLLNDMHVVLVASVQDMPDAVPGTVSVDAYDVLVSDEDLLRSLGDGGEHTVFRMTDMEKRMLPRKRIRLDILDVTVIASADGYTVTGSTPHGFQLQSISITDTVGVTPDPDGVSFVPCRLSDIVFDAGLGLVSFHLAVDSSAGFPPLAGEDLHIFPKVKELVDNSRPQYQLFDVVETSVDAGVNGMILQLRMPEGTPQEVLDVMSGATMLVIGPNEHQLAPQGATVDHALSTIRFAVLEAPSLTIGHAVQGGLLARYAGFPLAVTTQVRLATGVYLWHVTPLMRMHSLVEQFDGTQALVLDGACAYVVTVVRVLSPLTMIVMISAVWDETIATRGGSRSVYLTPLAVSQSLEYDQALKVPGLSVSGSATVDRLQLTSTLTLPSIRMGDPASNQRPMDLGYVGQGSNTFMFGAPDLLVYRDVHDAQRCSLSLGRPLTIDMLDSNAVGLRVSSCNAEGVSMRVDGSILCLGGVHVPSDERHKSRVREVPGPEALRSVAGLRVARYRSMLGREELGVMAQDLLTDRLARHAVSTDDPASLAVRHDMLSALALGAVKHLTRALLGRVPVRRRARRSSVAPSQIR